MSTENQNLSCGLCHAYLFEEDDVVYCPVCGAPHHRECYNHIGHCALEEFHGTDKQYDKIKKAEPKPSEPQKSVPPSQQDNTPFSSFPQIDFLGGVPEEYLIDQDVTAKDVRNFVISNTMRYVPKFATLNKNNKISWNFMAFLFPCAWFLSRKMYKNGIVAGVLTIISTLLSIPLNNTLYNLGVMDTTSYPQLMENLMSHINQISGAVVIASFIGAVLGIAIRIVCALLGDYWYKTHSVNTIKEIKKSSDDIDFDFRKKGGVNFFLFFIGVFAVQYIPTIIMTLI